MPKRLKYLLVSFFSVLTFALFLALPNEFRYYGLMAGSGFLVLAFWLSLGMAFEGDLGNRVMFVLLPVSFFIGYGLFTVLLPFSVIGSLVVSLVFGATVYVMLLVENVFSVAIDFKTVPLYRAAYTVGFILMLITAFFLFDSILSYRSSFWLNASMSALVAGVLSTFHGWTVVIGEKSSEPVNRVWTVVVPSIILAELSGIISFWPVGIFRGSVYLVFALYLVSSLLQADIRQRLFRPVWVGLVWTGISVLMAIVLVTNWR